MKRPYTFIQILFVAAFFFFSCSKNGNSSPNPTSITGKWNITADTSQTVGYAPYIIVGINSPYMQFNADGTGAQKNNISTPDVALNFTYTLSKHIISFNYPNQPQLAGGSIIKGVIEKLTSNRLIIEYDLSDPTLTVNERVYMSR